MNTQKQVTFTDLKGKFNKDFDNFGKMDPFLQFTVGKCFGKTQIASSAGKEPSWKDQVVLTYFDEIQIFVKAYDDDATEKQFIGMGKIEIKSLRFPGGSIEITIMLDNGETIGTITGKYTIKNLAQSPLLLVKNFRLELGTQQSTIIKSKPFIKFSTDDNQASTEQKNQIQGLSVSWSQNLRLKIKQSSKITISLIDVDNKIDYLFKYQCFAKQFRLQSGKKRFNVFNKSFQKFAVLYFDYETVNLVSKEESVKNLQRQKKAQNQLTAILIERMSSQLKIEGKDVYFKLIVGTNNFTTDLLKNNQKIFTVQVKKTLYAEDKQNKLVLVLFGKDFIGQSVIGAGQISLESLFSGEKKVQLLNQAKQDVGSVSLNLTYKVNPSKILILQNLFLNLYENGDLIGQSESFILAKIGNCQGRTEIGESNRLTFKRGIQLKYFDQQFLQLEIWDQDVTSNELLFTQKLRLVDLKGNKGQQQVIYRVQNKEGKSETKAKLTFKYQLKSNVVQIPRKVTQKKIEPEIVKKEPQIPKKGPQIPKKEPQIPKKEPVVPPSIQKPKNISVEPQKAINPLPQTATQPIVQQKPAKKEEILSAERPLQTLETKPAQTNKPTKNKTEQNEIERAPDPIYKNEQLNSSKREVSTKKNGKQSFAIDKSRQSIIFPSIAAGSRLFGDKIFDKQSAATLQKSIVAYSMPKANRFTNQPKYSGEPTYCMDSCFRPNPTKGAGFGFGNKRQFPEWMERNMKENPPPGAYIDDKNAENSKGPTFGLSHKYYQKVLIPKEKKVATGHAIRKLSPIQERYK